MYTTLWHFLHYSYSGLRLEGQDVSFSCTQSFLEIHIWSMQVATGSGILPVPQSNQLIESDFFVEISTETAIAFEGVMLSISGPQRLVLRATEATTPRNVFPPLE